MAISAPVNIKLATKNVNIAVIVLCPRSDWQAVRTDTCVADPPWPTGERGGSRDLPFALVDNGVAGVNRRAPAILNGHR
jgi:hypothetical protein